MPPRRSSRDQVLNQPRSGARPLSGSPGPSRPPRDAGSRADVRAARERYRSGRSPEADERLRDRAVTDARAAQDRERQRERERREMSGGSPQSAGRARAAPAGGSPQRKSRSLPGAPRSTRRSGDPGKVPAYHNYQAIILAEFVTAELLVAATPIATRKNKAGLSPYIPRDLVKLLAIGFTYFALQLVASGGRSAGRFSAWFGALILLAVGLGEANHIAKDLDVLTGGSGKTKTTAVTTAEQTDTLASFTPPTVGGGGGGSLPQANSSAGRRKPAQAPHPPAIA